MALRLVYYAASRGIATLSNLDMQQCPKTFCNNVQKYFAILSKKCLQKTMLMNHENGIYQICNPAELPGKDYDRVIWDGVAHPGEMTYYSVSEDYGNGGNYIASLKPGESIQVNMAWIVNENELDHMYLNLNGDGGVLQFSDSTLKSGVVDICQ